MTATDERIQIGPAEGTVVVRAGGVEIARSERALALHEAGHPPVYYVPRADVDDSRLEASTRRTHCPYKGDARYHTIVVGDDRIEDAAWVYPDPLPGVDAIRDHLAFYPERVDSIDVEE